MFLIKICKIERKFEHNNKANKEGMGLGKVGFNILVQLLQHESV
jgi:hypothetical protein